MYESHVHGLYLASRYVVACIRISLDLLVTLYIWQCLHMLHGDTNILVLLEGTCIYFGRMLYAYDWVSVDQDGHDGICHSVMYLFYFI